MTALSKKMLVAGVLNMAGRAKSSGNPYSMFKMTVLEPTVIQGNIANACGYESREIDTEEQVLRQLQHEKFPVEVEAFMDIGRDNKIRVQSVRILEQRAIEPVSAAKVGAAAQQKPAA